MTSAVGWMARLSLSFLWMFTAITSAFFAKDVGYEVLAGRGITGGLANFCILSGSMLNAIIGLWLFVGKSLKLCYLVQLVVIASYTLLLTVIAPGFWLHPFGPLTKNIPLFVLIYCLYRKERQR